MTKPTTRRWDLCRLPARYAWLCVAAATGLAPHASCAQGSVVLYGLIDMSLETTNPGNGSTTRMDSGAYRGTRFGLYGDEPLGGTLHALVRLESGFSGADGTLSQPGTLFSRQAWVGLRDSWGELRAGRQYSPLYIPFKGKLDAFGAGTIASGLDNLSKITPYVSDAMTWISPDFHGFHTTLMASVRDSSDADGNGLSGYYVTSDYDLGGLSLHYARQQTHGTGALRSDFGGASYGVGEWKAWVAYFNGEGGAPFYHAAGVSLSAQWQVTPTMSVSAGYVKVKDWSALDGGAQQFSAEFQYSVSRTLLLYASVADLKNEGESRFTLRGVNVTGLPAAYPGAPVRGMQFGMIEQF